MEHLMGLIKLADKEFGEMEQNGKFRNKDDVELAYKLVDVVKDSFEIMKCEAEMASGYSENGYGYGYPMNNYPMAGYLYEGGNPYAQSMQNRNARGQFTSYNGYGNYNSNERGGSNYSQGGGAKAGYLNQLYQLMDKAPDEQTRAHIQKMIHDAENS